MLQHFCQPSFFFVSSNLFFLFLSFSFLSFLSCSLFSPPKKSIMSAVDPRLSAQQAQGEPAAPVKHHKEQEFNPALSTTSKDAMAHWLAAPVGFLFFSTLLILSSLLFHFLSLSMQVSGNLNEVPGVAAGNSAHLVLVDGQAGRTEADVITNTYVPPPPPPFLLLIFFSFHDVYSHCCSYQLLGKFLLMRDTKMTTKDNVQVTSLSSSHTLSITKSTGTDLPIL